VVLFIYTSMYFVVSILQPAHPPHGVPTTYCMGTGRALNWGRILGRNPDKSFPHCCSQSPLQLFLEIYISSNSSNLLRFFFKLRQPPTISTVKCIKRRKEEKLIENHTPFQMFLEFIQKYRNAQKPQRNCTFMNSASLPVVLDVFRGNTGAWEVAEQLLSKLAAFTLVRSISRRYPVFSSSRRQNKNPAFGKSGRSIDKFRNFYSQICGLIKFVRLADLLKYC